MKSIQTKFIILILSCVLLSAVIIGGAGVISAERVIDENSAQAMKLMCKEKACELDGLFSRIEQSVNTLATYTTETFPDLNSFQSDPEVVNEYTDYLQSFVINAANNTEGALAVYVRYNPDFTDPVSGLFWSKTTLDGQLKELTPTDLSRYSLDDSNHVSWYYLPVKNNKATWLDPYMNKNINVEVVSYVVPLYAGHTIVGVVGMDINFDIIREKVDKIKIYDSGYAFLTDENAKLMVHGSVGSGDYIESLESSLTDVSNELKKGVSDQLFSYQWQNQSKRLTFRSLRNGMRLAVTAPVSEIDSAKNRLIVQILISTLVIVALAVFLTVLMTRQLIRPLKELNDAAKKIAGGDLSVSLSHHTKDEVGMLADSFRQTVEHLQKYIDYINGLAYRDGLTGVRNKTAYKEAADRLEEKIRSTKLEFAMVVFDVNNLKKINDTQGHDFGDMLIIDACKLIGKVFRHCAVYRIGGDEFVTILENWDYEHYNELLEQFQQALNEYNSSVRAGREIVIARGIAVYDEHIDLTVNDVFKRADNAMYRNKLFLKQQEKDVSQNLG